MQSLTHLTNANQRRIEALQLELAERNAQMARMVEEFADACHNSTVELAKKEEEIQQISRQLMEREAELYEL